MKTPIFITNFKLYKSGTGDKAIQLAHIHQELGTKFGVNVVCAPQASDIRMISNLIKTPVFSQHIDPVGFGKGTGQILPEAVKEAGAKGTLLNHSEKRISKEKISLCVKRAKDLGLITVVCAETPEEGKSFLEFNPDFIAVEPPDLIGGEVSVTTKPEIISKSAELIGKEKLIIGAGIKTADDIKKGLELGSSGILIASGVMKAENPEEVLKELIGAMGMKKY